MLFEKCVAEQVRFTKSVKNWNEDVVLSVRDLHQHGTKSAFLCERIWICSVLNGEGSSNFKT